MDFLTAARGSRPSWGWQGLLLGRDSISHGFRWSVGDGRKIRIRKDCWLPKGVLGGPANQHEPFKVADLVDPQTNDWNFSVIHELYDYHTVQQILAIHVSPSHIEDQLIWTKSIHGDYTVRSGYQSLRQTAIHQSQPQVSPAHTLPQALWKHLWKLQVAPKVKFFIWALCHNVLPTRDNLFHRHITSDPICPLYQDTLPETATQLFLFCPKTVPVWSMLAQHMPIHIHTTHSIEHWVAAQILKQQNSPDSTTLAYVLWNLWKARNHFIFCHQQLDPPQIVDSALIHARSIMLSSPCSAAQVQQGISGGELWRPPEPDTIEVNFDGAFDPHTTSGTIATICRDQRGRMLDGLTRTITVSSPLQAEFMALLLTLRYRQQTGRQQDKLILESDSLILVEAINELTLPPWEVRSVFAEVQFLLRSFSCARVVHC